MNTEIIEISNDLKNTQFLSCFQDKNYESKKLTVLDLFSGGGGLALGFEKAGCQHVLLNEIDKRCCHTLLLNRPEWPVLQADISTVDFKPYNKKVDIITGGFPCQSFSALGKRKGFDDPRGALFFQFLRAIKEVEPKLFIGENVKGLLNHNKGQTLRTMIGCLEDLGYRIVTKILNSAYFHVPQARERLIIVGVQKNLPEHFSFPKPNKKICVLQDALKRGSLYPSDTPASKGIQYSKEKQKIFSHVPPGKNWRSLPIYLKKLYEVQFKNGKCHSFSQVARRLAWEKPSLTLLVSPEQNRAERCHPDEARPLTVREYARIQTFPDEWVFSGSLSSQYKQIGNAVPVNLAFVIARSAMTYLSAVQQ